MSEAVIGFLGALVIIWGSVVASYYLEMQHEREMAKLGYIEVQAEGTSDTLWVKP